MRWFHVAAGMVVLASVAVVIDCSSSDPNGGFDGSATPDASTSDVDISDAGTEAGDGAKGAPSCQGLLFCDDFETYLDADVLKSGTMLGPWITNIHTATMNVDTERAYTGQRALHMTFPPSQAGGLLQRTVDAGLVPNHGNMYGRTMLYFASTPTDAGPAGIPITGHAYFFMAKGFDDALDAGSTVDIAQVTGSKVFVNYFPPNHFELNAFEDAGSLTTDAWHCLQWEVDDASMSPAHVRIWFDQQLVVDWLPQTQGSKQGWTYATPWTMFSFGYGAAQPVSNPVDLTLDTFALDSNPIACP